MPPASIRKVKTYISYQSISSPVILIKIVILTPYFYPVIGGITTFVKNLQDSLVKKGYPVSIISGQGKRKDDVVITGSNKLIYINLAFLSLRTRRIEVIHSNAHWYVLLPGVLYKFLHSRTKLIHSFHTEPMKNITGLKKKTFEFLLSKCDCITFVSYDLMDKVEKRIKIHSKKKVIPPGAFTEEKSEKEIQNFKNNYNLGNSSPILSFIGPLSWELKVEGVKRLIEAFIIMKETYPRAKLLIVGDGVNRKKLERFVEMNKMNDDVIFTGFLDDTETPLIITDIYTHISLQDTFSISTLEAMRMGKPIIAAKTGGLPELITHGETGILVEPAPKQIAQTIIALYNDKKRMEYLGENAKKVAKKMYDWDNIVNKYIDLYKGIY
jgi:glycosyltransferase involved in cell wall biosynthesis